MAQNCQLSIVNCQFGEAAKFQFLYPLFTSRQPRLVSAGRTFRRGRRTFFKKGLTKPFGWSKIAPTFIEQGSEGKSKPVDAVQRAPAGGKGYG